MPDLLGQLRAYGRQIEADKPSKTAAPEPTQPGIEPFEAKPFRSTEWVEPAGSAEPDQRAGWHPRSVRRSGRSAWLAVAAATVAVTLAVSLLVPAARPEGGTMDNRIGGLTLGVCLFVVGCTSGTEGASTTAVADPTTASPTVSSTVSGLPRLASGSDDVPVEAGTYLIDVFSVPIEITVPAGWTVFDEVVLHGRGGASLVLVTGAWDVYTNACQWLNARADVGPTVSDMVTALVAQQPTVHTEPRDVTVGGYHGTELVISSPSDLDYATCYGGSYATMIDDLHRQAYVENPGDAQTTRVIDLNGERIMISFWSTPETSEATKAELDAMVGSLKFG
jgi:hypothetical protein